MARTPLVVALLLAVPLGRLVGAALGPDEVARAERPSARPVAALAAAGTAAPSAPASTPPAPLPAPAPVRAAAATAPDVEAVLEALDEGRPLDAAGLALVRATVEDAAAEAPLRAGCLRALLDADGLRALPGLCDLYGRDDAAPLRPLVAQAVAAGAGPQDAPLVGRLLEGAARADERGRLLALEAAVRASTRGEAPARLGDELDDRVRSGLLELARGPASPEAARAGAIAALGELAGRDLRARDALADLAAGARDAEDRLDAAVALHRVDANRGERALDAVGATLDDPLLRARWAAVRDQASADAR